MKVVDANLTRSEAAQAVDNIMIAIANDEADEIDESDFVADVLTWLSYVQCETDFVVCAIVNDKTTSCIFVAYHSLYLSLCNFNHHNLEHYYHDRQPVFCIMWPPFLHPAASFFGHLIQF